MKIATDNLKDLSDAMDLIREAKSNLLDEGLTPNRIDELVKAMVECNLKVAK